MFILRDLLQPLQACFSDGESDPNHERGTWFVYTLLCVTIHFTSARTSNLLRAMETLFGFNITLRRFYTFMASPKLPWGRLWCKLWLLIPNPTVDGRLLLALDDFINPKTGKHIFGCSALFDHAAKTNQSSYPWAQNVVSIGLLKRIKGRWACLPMAFRFYHMKKTIDAGLVKIKGVVPKFQTKFDQATEMVGEVAKSFPGVLILIVCDSWFGNNGLFDPARKFIGKQVHLLSRLRSNATLYDFPVERSEFQRGRPRKYGEKLGNAKSLASARKDQAQTYSVNLYGKVREVSAYSQVVVLKTLQCAVRVVWVYRKSQWVALFSTDLDLSVTQIIEFYGARWKIEAGFKELKQDIGSSSSQTRDPVAVSNHLHFCMMGSTLTWLYADRLEHTPQRHHAVGNRKHFAFSDVRKLVTQAALHPDFDSLFPKHHIPPEKSFLQALMRMVA